MFPRPIDVYLNDHLAGATLGSDLAEHIRDANEGTPLGEVMASVCAEIDSDRETLLGLMERMEVAKNPVKQAGAWVAEKAARVKFGGLGAGERELGTFLALESLSLGIEGKADLWRALREVAGEHPPVAALDLDGLIARAETQRATVERERTAAAVRTLTAT
jgi:hypothetical protein